MSATVAREIDGDGVVTLRTARCAFRVVRPAPGVVSITITGHDSGEFGTAVFDEVRADVVRYAPITLFIDLSGAIGAVVGVQDQWSQWFTDHRRALADVHLLAAGSYLTFAAEVVKHWSRTGEMIRVHTDRASFEAALRRVAPSYAP